MIDKKHTLDIQNFLMQGGEIRMGRALSSKEIEVRIELPISAQKRVKKSCYLKKGLDVNKCLDDTWNTVKEVLNGKK